MPKKAKGSLPEVVMPKCPIEKILSGQKAPVTGTSPVIDGGMTLYPGFTQGG